MRRSKQALATERHGGQTAQAQPARISVITLGGALARPSPWRPVTQDSTLPGLFDYVFAGSMGFLFASQYLADVNLYFLWEC